MLQAKKARAAGPPTDEPSTNDTPPLSPLEQQTPSTPVGSSLSPPAPTDQTQQAGPASIGGDISSCALRLIKDRKILTLTVGRLRSGAATKQSRTLEQRHIEELKAAEAKYAEQLEAVLEEKNKLATELREKQNALDKAVERRDQFKDSNRINYCEAKKLEQELAASRQETTTLEGHIEKLEQANASNLESNPLVTHSRKNRFPVVSNQRSLDSGASSSEIDERLVFKDESSLDGGGNGASELAEVPSVVLHSSDVKREIMMLSIPVIAGQALDPLAQLMETAYIGRLGSLELGSAGVSVNIFNYISKLFNILLLSVATSFVAEDISRSENNSSASETHFLNNSSNGSRPFDVIAERKQLPSVSTTLLLAVMIGTFEALALSLGSGLFLNIMGISSDSPMRAPAHRFLSLRALGAPAVVVSLALQGVFRGFKDTKTPVLCLGIGNLLAVILFPILMYSFQMGATGATISIVVSQYVVTFLMLWFLNKRAILRPLKMGSLQFGGYIKSGGFLLGRTLAVLTTMTLGTSMAGRYGPVAMAAHQICLQVWLVVSLLVDALGASAHALTASYMSKGDYKTVREIAHYVLKVTFPIALSPETVLAVHLFLLFKAPQVPRTKGLLKAVDLARMGFERGDGIHCNRKVHKLFYWIKNDNDEIRGPHASLISLSFNTWYVSYSITKNGKTDID
ncbi:protein DETOXIFICATION 45, chloroplastic-like [Humulus lupulus]|uniref:protein DETOXIFICATION 45, chloroplastic-like n=1 Tax=Humulus lupulus TaxID=3486 RepID=UPI002B416896|nr:protein DETOXIFICATION 45, chloroplastic-like [Humulus lupulus]